MPPPARPQASSAAPIGRGYARVRMRVGKVVRKVVRKAVRKAVRKRVRMRVRKRVRKRVGMRVGMRGRISTPSPHTHTCLDQTGRCANLAFIRTNSVSS